jgi:hypothetical protein
MLLFSKILSENSLFLLNNHFNSLTQNSEHFEGVILEQAFVDLNLESYLTKLLNIYD